MTEAAASIFEEMGGMSIRSEYRGTGMSGTTTAVVGDPLQWREAIAEIIRRGDLLSEAERKEVARAIAEAQMDDMGMELIYY